MARRMFTVLVFLRSGPSELQMLQRAAPPAEGVWWNSGRKMRDLDKMAYRRKKYIRRAGMALAGGAALYLLLRWARRSGPVASDPARTPDRLCLDDENFGEKFQDCLSAL